MGNELILDEDAFVLISEPCPNHSASELAEQIDKIASEKELAALFATVSNEEGWVCDDADDYEEGTEEYLAVLAKHEEWYSLEIRLKDMIADILRKENIDVPEKGWHYAMIPFMERNGFFDGNGWWLPQEEEGND